MLAYFTSFTVWRYFKKSDNVKSTGRFQNFFLLIFSSPPPTLDLKKNRKSTNKQVLAYLFYYYIDVYAAYAHVLLDCSLTVKAATLIFISGCGSAISSAKEGTSNFIYNFVKSL